MLYGRSTDSTGIAVIIVHDVRTHHALVSPRVAELYLLIDDTVGVILFCELVDVLAASGHLGGVHVAGALAAVHILAAYLRQRILIIGQLDGIAAGKRAVAEAVGADIAPVSSMSFMKPQSSTSGADYQHTAR